MCRINAHERRIAQSLPRSLLDYSEKQRVFGGGLSSQMSSKCALIWKRPLEEVSPEGGLGRAVGLPPERGALALGIERLKPNETPLHHPPLGAARRVRRHLGADGQARSGIANGLSHGLPQMKTPPLGFSRGVYVGPRIIPVPSHEARFSSIGNRCCVSRSASMSRSLTRPPAAERPFAHRL